MASRAPSRASCFCNTSRINGSATVVLAPLRVVLCSRVLAVQGVEVVRAEGGRSPLLDLPEERSDRSKKPCPVVRPGQHVLAGQRVGWSAPRGRRLAAPPTARRDAGPLGLSDVPRRTSRASGGRPPPRGAGSRTGASTVRAARSSTVADLDIRVRGRPAASPPGWFSRSAWPSKSFRRKSLTAWATARSSSAVRRCRLRRPGRRPRPPGLRRPHQPDRRPDDAAHQRQEHQDRPPATGPRFRRTNFRSR